MGTVAIPQSDSFGFFVSEDGGQSFQKRTSGIEGASAFSMAVDPADPAHVVLGTINDGVFESMDAGDSWNDISAGVLATDSFGFAEDATDPEHLLYSSTAWFARHVPRVRNAQCGGDVVGCRIADNARRDVVVRR